MPTNARVIGVGHFVPQRVISNDRIAKAIPGWSPEQIREKTGIEERRFLWDFDSDTGVAIPPPEGERLFPISNTDMCEVAMRQALAMAGVPATQVDALLLVTCTPDELNFSHDAMALHQRFGMRRDAFAMVIDDGCGGTPYVIDFARKMLESGAMKTIVVVASAFTSPLVNRKTYTAQFAPVPGEKGFSGYLSMYVFGDAAGAIVLRADEGPSGRIISSMSMNSHEELVFRRGGGALKHMHQGRASDAELAFVVNGPAVARDYPRAMKECLERVLEGTPYAKADVERFYLHQPNRRVLEMFMRHAELSPERVAMNVHRYGNTSAAGMLVLFSEDLQAGTVHLGGEQLVLLAAVGANVHAGAQLLFT